MDRPDPPPESDPSAEPRSNPEGDAERTTWRPGKGDAYTNETAVRRPPEDVLREARKGPVYQALFRRKAEEAAPDNPETNEGATAERSSDTDDAPNANGLPTSAGLEQVDDDW